MIKLRIEEKPAFKVVGRKIWISGTNDTQLFGQFWKNSHENGLINTLKQIRGDKLGPITNSMVLGISCVEKDPSNRSFNFYIATESNENSIVSDLEEYTVPASKWAIFENKGEMPQALVNSEMYAFRDWLPNSSYVHVNAPELEVYPPNPEGEKSIISEFWLPIKEKE